MARKRKTPHNMDSTVTIESSVPQEEMEIIHGEVIEQDEAVKVPGGEIMRFMVNLDCNIVKAAKIMAAHEGHTIQDYLNNFFKNFIAYQAEVWKDPNLEAMVKEILKDVPFK